VLLAIAGCSPTTDIMDVFGPGGHLPGSPPAVLKWSTTRGFTWTPSH